MKGYYPSTNAGAVVWLTNYKAQIAIQGAILGMTAAQITNQQNFAQNLIDAIHDIEAKKAALAASVQNFRSAQTHFLAPLKIEIARYKTSATYTPAIGQLLGVISTHHTIDTATYKCKFTVEHFGGFVRIKFIKAGVEGVNIYRRRKGQTEWKFLARDTQSPYDNHIVLQTLGQPEHWEYQLFGVIEDQEIGLASDIVEVLYGG